MKKRKKRVSPKLEFSKKIFYIIICIFVAVIIYAMALMWKTGTTDGLAYLIPSVGTLAAAGVSFYFWKAKSENLLKISKQMELDKIQETNNMISDVSSSIQGEDINM